MITDCQRPRSRTDATRPRAPVHTDAGALLAGRYRLAELVGRGATARVWRAHDELLNRDVAVKQLRGRHPHGILEARLCYGRALPPPIVAALGWQLLAALSVVHAAGVVHCDVKPTNLLLGDGGRLMLTDFGIAETGGGTPIHPARRNGYVIGSPVYMAPEVVRGETPQPASDLWSLGATLYTAVEGRLPFPQRDPVPTLAAVLHDPPSPAQLAGRLQPLLARLLVKDPRERPTHADIHALLNDAYPAPPTLVFPRRNRPDPQTHEPVTPTAASGPRDRPTSTATSIPAGL